MSLKEKLKKLQETKSEKKINWEEIKKEWINSVNKLYSDIRNWFSELESEGLLKILTSSITIFEEEIGTYSIDKMEIAVGNKDIILEPVGTNIIGADGRIDFYLNGEISNREMMVLIRENNVDNWYIINKINRNEKNLLTREFIERKLEEWLGL